MAVGRADKVQIIGADGGDQSVAAVVAGVLTVSGGGGGGGGAATIADGSDVTEGAIADAVVAAGAAGTVSAKLRRLTTDLAALLAKIPALGSATGANSLPVVIASNQGAVPVSGTVTITPSGTQGISVADGSDVNAGAVADAVVAAGASGSISAKLRRLTTDLSALLALIPASLGPKSNALSLAVVQPSSATGTQSSVASSATTVTVLASNAARIGATIFNESAAILYLKFGATASVTSYAVQINPGGYYEVPFRYTGIIDGIWASANGNARVTELT